MDSNDLGNSGDRYSSAFYSCEFGIGLYFYSFCKFKVDWLQTILALHTTKYLLMAFSIVTPLPNTATVSGLNQGTTYNFYVNAVDAAGNISPQSNTVSGTTLIDTQAPTEATNLAVTSVGTNSIAIQWNAGTDNIEVAGYNIFVNGALYGSTTSTSTNVANLDPNTAYSIYVVTKDARGKCFAAK